MKRFRDIGIGFVIGIVSLVGWQVANPVQYDIQNLNENQLTDVRAALTLDNCLIRWNEARINAGVKQVPTQDLAIKDAQLRADDIHSGKTTYSHDGFRKYRQDGTFKQAYGEVLVQAPTCTEAINKFLESPTHKTGVLDPDQKYIGIGIAGNTVVVLTHR